jgi:hypothetical protein
MRLSLTGMPGGEVGYHEMMGGLVWRHCSRWTVMSKGQPNANFLPEGRAEHYSAQDRGSKEEKGHRQDAVDANTS